MMIEENVDLLDYKISPCTCNKFPIFKYSLLSPLDMRLICKNCGRRTQRLRLNKPEKYSMIIQDLKKEVVQLWNDDEVAYVNFETLSWLPSDIRRPPLF